MDINDELKKAQLDKDWDSIKRIFDKINDICQQEADMNVLEFLKYRDNTSESCRYYSLHSKTKIGPYKNKPNWNPITVKYKTSIERRFQEDAINDMDMGEQ
tara:strand:- start:325 stop:627 length:303 start_codon:yes stop_codon:yes gene_type:complete